MKKIIEYIKSITFILFLLFLLSAIEKFLLGKYFDFFNGWVCVVIYLAMIKNIEKND